MTGVHELVYDCIEQCDNLSDKNKDSSRVKIAMLDTGFQLPEGLRSNYEDGGRIIAKASESFLPNTQEATDHNWEVDCDGHGSRVGQIILDVAPSTDLYVARVFKHGSDLAKPKMAAEIHKSISEVICS